MRDGRDVQLSRRQLIAGSAVAAAAMAIGNGAPARAAGEPAKPLPLPRGGKPVPVAFLMDEAATMIDFAGPWEVFQDAHVAGVPGFRLFTVAPSAKPFRATGGMQIVPDYTLDNAPEAKVIVVPAQKGGRDPRYAGAKLGWLRERHARADVVLSVCTGAFLLARTGLLDGLEATTHHRFFDQFESQFPNVRLVRHERYVENGSLMTTAGLSSGVDGALRIVERYYGRDAAVKTAIYMEYESERWRTPA